MPCRIVNDNEHVAKLLLAENATWLCARAIVKLYVTTKRFGFKFNAKIIHDTKNRVINWRQHNDHHQLFNYCQFYVPQLGILVSKHTLVKPRKARFGFHQSRWELCSGEEMWDDCVCACVCVCVSGGGRSYRQSNDVMGNCQICKFPLFTAEHFRKRT